MSRQNVSAVALQTPLLLAVSQISIPRSLSSLDLWGDLMIGTMMTKIFHPNVSKSGEICVDTLKKAWKREYGVGHVLVVSRCYLPAQSCLSALFYASSLRNPDKKT